MTQPPPQPIRDQRYYTTLYKDLAWHQIRRWRHKLGLWQEKRLDWLHRPCKKDSQTVSVCIITMNAADRIAPLIQHCKGFVDEVVIGVDSKTSDDTFQVCKDAGADVVFTIENNAQTCNAGLEDLVKACSGDWILRLDDDEYMEPEFVAMMPNLMQQTLYTHFKIPRLHISHIEPLQWVNDSYLYPDYQMRFFQNRLEQLHFPGAVGHTSITSDGMKGRLYQPNIIHLNLAINNRQKREAKLAKYILRHHGQWVHPINEYALLFEDFNYHIEAYRHPDTEFCNLLSRVVKQVQQGQHTEHSVQPILDKSPVEV